jgi:hypothetical protein
MAKARIVERTNVDGSIVFVIQQPHFLLRWIWVDAWINSFAGADCQDTYSTLEEARKNLIYFNGSRGHDRVVEYS